MANIQTIRAFEDFSTERHILNIKPAFATSMTASFGLGVFDKLSTTYYSLVGQHLNETIPRSIVYKFGIIGTVNHAFDIQILNSNNAVSQSEVSAKFMVKIRPLVSNFVVQSGYFKPCLSPVSRAFFLSAQSSLYKLESFLALDKEFRVVNTFTIAEEAEVIPAVDINANLFNRWMLNNDIRQFTAKEGKPLSSLVLLDSQGLDFASWGSMQNNRNTTNLAEFKPSLIQKLKSRLRIGYATNFALKSGITCFNLDSFFAKLNPVKEVVKSLMQSVRDILQNLRMCLIIIRRAGSFNVLHERIKIKLLGCHKLFVLAKKSVVYVFAYLKLVKKSYFLLVRRIYSIFVGSHIIYYKDKVIYKPYGHLSSVQWKKNKMEVSDLIIQIHPTAKACGLSLANPL